MKSQVLHAVWCYSIFLVMLQLKFDIYHSCDIKITGMHYPCHSCLNSIHSVIQLPQLMMAATSIGDDFHSIQSQRRIHVFGTIDFLTHLWSYGCFLSANNAITKGYRCLPSDLSDDVWQRMFFCLPGLQKNHAFSWTLKPYYNCTWMNEGSQIIHMLLACPRGQPPGLPHWDVGECNCRMG